LRTTRSKRLLKRARAVIPGGVNSPVRAFGAVGGTARFIESASGARIEDVDGNRYIDFVSSWGPIIVGHAHPVVVEAIRRAAGRGTSFGAPTEAEVEIAERVIQAVPSVEMVRFVNSGTEAVMSALRLARAATARDRIVKFEGCYHGHSNELLVAAGSGVATLGIPGTAGVTEGAARDTLALPYNDLGAVEAAFEAHPGEIAAVVLEPAAANMGLVLPQPGFLEGLRALCDEHETVLIFDEVITGFRVALGGAQAHFGVVPDLTTFGKVIGGGLPVGAYGGRRSLMERIAPEGDVFQAGTLSGNPVAVAAGLATLDLLEREGVYEGLTEAAATLAEGFAKLAEEAGVEVTTCSLGGIFGFFFCAEPVIDYAGAQAADGRRYAAFFQVMLEQGIYLAPSPFEVAFVTTAHGSEEIAATLEAARRAFRKAS
jgi:glutamate-1-semialdehyde 2,1-aminomutase